MIPVLVQVMLVPITQTNAEAGQETGPGGLRGPKKRHERSTTWHKTILMGSTGSICKLASAVADICAPAR